MKRKHTSDTPLPLYDTMDVDYMSSIDNVLYYSELYPNKHQFPSYFRIDQFVVELIMSGTFDAQMNLQDYHIEAPCLLIILPDTVLHYERGNGDCMARAISHRTRDLSDLHIAHFSHSIIQTIRENPVFKLTEEQAETFEKYYDLLKLMMQSQERSKNSYETVSHLIQAMLLYLEGIFTERISNTRTYGRAHEITNTFLFLVENNCGRQKNIAYYAEQLCVSAKYLASVVKETTNKTVGTWIDDYLLLQAKTMLTTSTYNIQQISNQLGFANQSHFGTWFRRQTGIGPKEFRQNAQARWQGKLF